MESIWSMQPLSRPSVIICEAIFSALTTQTQHQSHIPLCTTLCHSKITTLQCVIPSTGWTRKNAHFQYTILMQPTTNTFCSWVMRCWCGYLSAWSEVQVVCIWSRWYYCIPKPHHLLPHLNPDWFYLSGQPAYSGCAVEQAVKRV